jgi:hypothetical protein
LFDRKDRPSVPTGIAVSAARKRGQGWPQATAEGGAKRP